MAHHNSQQNNNPYNASHVWNSLTPPLTAPMNGQPPPPPPQLAIHANNNNNNYSLDVMSSQPVSLTSLGSSSSMYSTSSQVLIEDKLFDKIEDMLCEYMREPNRHYLHCRVLRWSLDDDESRLFTAVVIINPPTAKN